MKKVLLFCLFILSSILLSKESKACDILFAWDPWAPYQMEVDGKLTGFDIEIVEKIMNKAGCKVRFQEQNWTRIMDGIKDGTIDMGGAASKTPEREAFSVFSVPYRQEKMVLFNRKGESGKYNLKTISDIVPAGMKVSVLKDYSYGEEFDKLAGDSANANNIDYATDAELNIKKVVNGRTDAFLEDEIVGVYLAKKDGVLDKLEVNPVAVSVGDVHFMFSKKVSPENIAKINDAITNFKNSDEYKTIITKYTK